MSLSPPDGHGDSFSLMSETTHNACGMARMYQAACTRIIVVMAKHAERYRNRAHLWQLVIAAAAIALMVWAGFRFFDGNRERARLEATDIENDMPAASPNSEPAPVLEFVHFIQGNSPQERMRADHAFTSAGLHKMADALRALTIRYSVSDANVTSELQRLRLYADQLQEDPRSTEHADVIREAFLLASDLMGLIQRQVQPHLNEELADARQAAEAIEPDRPALRQKAEVAAFFEKAGSVLEGLAKARS
jgi:hypothetical protein